MSRAAQIAKVVRAELLAATGQYPQRTRVGVALSGGVDSVSILAAFLAQRIRPTVVSYTPETHESTDFVMARNAAARHGLAFVPVRVAMDAESLERTVRAVVSLGYVGKVQVECLSPMLWVVEAAWAAGLRHLFTGDQADGFFALSKWASHNADRAAGVPRGERTNVQGDTTSERIDVLRRRYWELDKSCSMGVRSLGLTVTPHVQVHTPYRSKTLLDAFLGSTWSEVNKPRPKEPIRLAFARELESLPTRRLPVNLHKGDSEFASTLQKTLLAQPHLQGWWRSTTGLYGAMARGEV